MSRLGSVRSTPRTLVVGAGFIGSSVVAALLADGHAVTVLTRTRPSPSVAARLAGARLVIGDAGDAAVVDAALADVGTVVYCAGAALPQDAERDPLTAERTALPPLLTVLEALRHRPGGRLAFISSGGTVYGDGGTSPLREDHPLRPESIYATLKVAAEHNLGVYRTRYGVLTTALRCANVYGASQAAWRSQGVVATLLAAAATGEAAPLFGDGRAVRDHIAVDDVAGAVVGLLRLGTLPPAVNVGTGAGTSLASLVGLVESVTGRPLRVDYRPARSTDLEHVVLDIGLLRSLVPFEPLPLWQGLASLWAGYEVELAGVAENPA